MEMDFALLCEKTLHFSPHHRFRMYIERDGKPVEGSVGEDTFAYNGMFFSGTPVGATGRSAVHRPQPDLTGYQGVPGTPVALLPKPGQTEEELLASLALWVDNNLILSQGELQTYYSLRARIDGRVLPIPLHTPLMKVHWEGKGLFRIALAGIGAAAL